MVKKKKKKKKKNHYEINEGRDVGAMIPHSESVCERERERKREGH